VLFNASGEKKGSGVEEKEGSGVEEKKGSGAEETVGSGAEETVGSGVEEKKGSGAEEKKGSGAEETVGPGAEETVGSDAEETVSSGGEPSGEFTAYGFEILTIKRMIVAGGGLSNGNAYATIEEDEENEEVYYCEYGKNPVRRVVGKRVVYVDNEGSFNVE
jgi:hypothetical protein